MLNIKGGVWLFSYGESPAVSD